MKTRQFANNSGIEIIISSWTIVPRIGKGIIGSTSMITSRKLKWSFALFNVCFSHDLVDLSFRQLPRDCQSFGVSFNHHMGSWWILCLSSSLTFVYLMLLEISQILHLDTRQLKSIIYGHFMLGENTAFFGRNLGFDNRRPRNHFEALIIARLFFVATDQGEGITIIIFVCAINFGRIVLGLPLNGCQIHLLFRTVYMTLFFAPLVLLFILLYFFNVWLFHILIFLTRLAGNIWFDIAFVTNVRTF